MRHFNKKFDAKGHFKQTVNAIYNQLREDRIGLSGEDLNKNPRISISTIHGVKGNERENVVVITDLAGAAFIDYDKNPDDTHRLFYVACTRTEKNLYIIEPQTKKAYNL